MSSLTSSRVLAPIGTAGKLFAFGLDVFRGLFRRPFQLREFIPNLAWHLRPDSYEFTSHIYSSPRKARC